MAAADRDSACGECKAVVKNNDQGLGCEGCGKWFHIRCVAVESKLYCAIMEFKSSNGSGLNWYCGTCNKGINEIRTEMMMFKIGLNEATKELEKVKAEIVEMKRDQGPGVVRKELERVKKEWGLDKVKEDMEQLRSLKGETIRQIGQSELDLKKSFRDILMEEREKQRVRVLDRRRKEGEG